MADHKSLFTKTPLRARGEELRQEPLDLLCHMDPRVLLLEGISVDTIVYASNPFIWRGGGGYMADNLEASLPSFFANRGDTSPSSFTGSSIATFREGVIK